MTPAPEPPPLGDAPDPAGVVIDWLRVNASPGDLRGVWPLLVSAALVTAIVAVLVLRATANTSAAQVQRWHAVNDRNDGLASARAIRAVASRRAMRKRALVLRPSHSELGRWQRWRTPTTEYATALAKVGPHRIWSPVEDVTLRIGGPRSGKTGELACRVLDAPGAVIATSTRTDLTKLTAPHRALRGPVQVFNPAGLAGHPTNIFFNPVAGCDDVNVAAYRAEDLLSGGSGPGAGDDREYWAAQAQRVLAALLHAAALGDLSIRDVQTWLADPETAAGTVTRLLRKSEQASVGDDATQFLTTNDRTRSSICSTVMPSLRWLADPVAAAAATGRGFDVERLLAEHGTVYLLGAEDAKVTPLVAALTGHVAREARRIAAAMPGGRLDPPLTLALDEAALICPIPLDRWTADMGGRNVTIHIAAQSRAQLRQRWGDTGAAAILNNTSTLLIFGGTTDRDDLTAWSVLTGERLEKVVARDGRGRIASTSTRRVPVLGPADIAALPPGHVLIKRRGMPPAVGTVQMAWERREVRRTNSRRVPHPVPVERATAQEGLAP
ncbi:MAG: type IV secretory system conjugative DNA transfer family protein [Sporichthyaceae bacterium]